MTKKSLKPDPSDVFDVDLHHKYLFFRRTKIVATIGPASSSPQKIRQLLSKGLNVVRINFSHGDPAEHVKTIFTIRNIAAELGVSIAIMGDLCGPKIRVGNFKNHGIMLKEGSVVTITTAPVVGHETLIPSQYKRLIKEISVHEKILL